MLLINKPTGITSHDVVDEVRKITGERRVGHAGTLDPFAEGLLIVLVGREETRQQEKFMGLDKTYEATFVLGAETDTFDVTGKIQDTNDNPPAGEPKEEKIKKALKKFEGEQMQMPPKYSAKKIKGKKAYELAREGKEVELKPKRVKIHEIKLVGYKWPQLKIKTNVSSGTYIRALARDIGQELEAGAYVEKLKRTSIGKYKLEDAKEITQIKMPKK